MKAHNYGWSGGHRGIGLALTESLLENGAKVGVIDLPKEPDAAFQLTKRLYSNRCFYARYTAAASVGRITS